MKDFHFDAIAAFENYEIEKMRDGHVVVTTKVVESSLNYYGNAHGGYLFTLCDQVSGLVVVSQGVDGVTLQSSINYLKAGVWVMSSRSMVNVSTVDGRLELWMSILPIKTGQCLQGNLYHVCYRSERWIPTSTHLKIIFLIFMEPWFEIRNGWVESHFYGIPWLGIYQSYGASYTGEGLRLRYKELVQQAEEDLAKEKQVAYARLIWRLSLCNCI